MAQLTKEDVLKLARLARLQLSQEEVLQFQRELNEVLQYVERLQNADVKGSEPTYQVTGLTNVTRPDAVRDYGTNREKLLKNTPALKQGYIKVRRIL